MNLGVGTLSWASQSATGQHSFLLLIKADSRELLPVADELVLNNNFVDCELALETC